MPCTMTEHPGTRVVELVVDGRVTQDDMDRLLPRMEAFIDAHGTVKLIEVVKDFAGFDASVIWPGIKFDFQHLRHVSHVALVSDIGWMTPLTKAAGAFMSTRIRIFTMDQMEDAVAWINDPDPA